MSLEWHYLIYEIPLLLTLLFGASLAVGEFGHHDADGAEGGHEIGGHDVHALHHDVDHVDVHHSHDADQNGDSGVLRDALTVFGIGRIPISLVIADICLSWGASGLILNNAVEQMFGVSPGLVTLPVMGVAGVTTVVGSIALGKALALVWPRTQSYGVSLDQLRGTLGVVVSPVTEQYGKVTVVDKFHTTHFVQCRVPAGQVTMPVGSRVLLTLYDEKTEVFTAELASDNDL